MKIPIRIPACLACVLVLLAAAGCSATKPPTASKAAVITPQHAELAKAFFARQEELARRFGPVAEPYLPTNSAARWEEWLAPEVWQFFAAGKQGDWRKLDALYLYMAKRSTQFIFPGATNDPPDPAVFVAWAPVNEAYWAFRELATPGAQSFVDYAEAVFSTLPTNAIYFAGSDVGRFMVECVGASSSKQPPLLLVSPNQLNSTVYGSYVRARYGPAISYDQAWDQQAFGEYLEEAEKRMKAGTPKPGESLEMRDGHVNPSGPGAVSEFNGLVMERIWRGNPDRPAFLEGYTVPDWVWPLAVPQGPLLRLERKPVEVFSDQVLAEDEEWWGSWMERTCGRRVTAVTPWKEIESLAHKHYQHPTDVAPMDPIWRQTQPRVVQDNWCGAPAIQRGQIAKLFSKRAMMATDSQTQQKLAQAASLAFRQAFALCPNAAFVTEDYLYWLACLRNREEAGQVLTFMEAQGRADGQPADCWKNYREWFQALPKVEPASLAAPSAGPSGSAR